ncbi:MAG: tripartite tricarboxylate transporter substrate binding protein [Alphaproteobacteria bacterium]|nr:tripartite tricarboxylate transporter substrate binding protein [Alphaproteobacteria bacterium]
MRTIKQGLGKQGLLAALLIAALPIGAAAADYPDRPVRLVVPYPAGTSTDLLARQVAPKAAEALGQPFVIDNRGGAGGIIGAEAVAKAAPDGYTLLFATSQTQAINVSLYKSLPYDPVKDFSGVARIGNQPLVLVVPPSLGVDSAPALIALARAKPGTLNYASTGSGTSAHLAGALLQSATKIDVIHVPYKSASQAISELLTGQVSMMLYPYVSLQGQIDAKALRVLATTGAQRSAFLPDAPTMVEAGFPDVVISAWYAAFAPKGTPAPIVQTLHAAFAKALADKDVRAAMVATGTDPNPSTPAELDAFMRAEIDRYRPLIATSGATVD